MFHNQTKINKFKLDHVKQNSWTEYFYLISNYEFFWCYLLCY